MINTAWVTEFLLERNTKPLDDTIIIIPKKSQMKYKVHIFEKK